MIIQGRTTAERAFELLKYLILNHPQRVKDSIFVVIDQPEKDDGSEDQEADMKDDGGGDIYLADIELTFIDITGS